MRGRRLRLLVTATLTVVGSLPGAVGAACSDSACVPGGGSAGSDCALEWLLIPVPPSAADGLPGRKVVCYEGDPLCDSDPDIGNQRCRFPLALCINNGDARLPDCLPSEVALLEVRRPVPDHPRDEADAANLAVLENGGHDDFGITVVRRRETVLAGVPNASADLCGVTRPIEVPLRQRHSGRTAKGRKTLRVAVTALSGQRDSDSLKLECRPSTCGNGTVESHEDCDDGGRANGDGCNQGCRVEVATPTPTTTPVPTDTVAATPTGTHSATPTPPPSATATSSRTATATHTNTLPPPATATATSTATATASASATATRTATATDTLTPTPTPTFTPPSFALGITAHRPQTEFYGGPFQRRAVPVGENLTPGVGVRINGDDDNNNGIADVSDAVIGNENDLVELTLQVNPFPAPPGFEYVLQRSNGGVTVWTSPLKGGSPLLEANDDAVVPFSSATRTVWVERVSAGDTVLQLVARPDGGGGSVASGGVRLFAFTSVVIALGGENQQPSDPPSSGDGMFNIAATLYGMGYDVHMYDEDDVGSSGAGPTYDEVVRAVSSRGIGIVSIFGYSHGGGSTHDLANRLDDNRGGIGIVRHLLHRVRRWHPQLVRHRHRGRDAPATEHGVPRELLSARRLLPEGQRGRRRRRRRQRQLDAVGRRPRPLVD